jgi:hypothetical protein
MDSGHQRPPGVELIDYVVLQAAAIADLHSNKDWRKLRLKKRNPPEE